MNKYEVILSDVSIPPAVVEAYSSYVTEDQLLIFCKKDLTVVAIFKNWSHFTLINDPVQDD